MPSNQSLSPLNRSFECKTDHRCADVPLPIWPLRNLFFSLEMNHKRNLLDDANFLSQRKVQCSKQYKVAVVHKVYTPTCIMNIFFKTITTTTKSHQENPIQQTHTHKCSKIFWSVQQIYNYTELKVAQTKYHIENPFGQNRKNKISTA